MTDVETNVNSINTSTEPELNTIADSGIASTIKQLVSSSRSTSVKLAFLLLLSAILRLMVLCKHSLESWPDYVLVMCSLIFVTSTATQQYPGSKSDRNGEIHTADPELSLNRVAQRVGWGTAYNNVYWKISSNRWNWFDYFVAFTACVAASGICRTILTKASPFCSPSLTLLRTSIRARLVGCSLFLLLLSCSWSGAPLGSPYILIWALITLLLGSPLKQIFSFLANRNISAEVVAIAAVFRLAAPWQCPSIWVESRSMFAGLGFVILQLYFAMRDLSSTRDRLERTLIALLGTAMMFY